MRKGRSAGSRQDTLELADVREVDVKRLMASGLIRTANDLLIPTTGGLERLQIERPPPARSLGQRRMKSRKLPF
jgi:hypothetical protein